MKSIKDTINARRICKISAAHGCGCCPYREPEPEVIDDNYVSCIKKVERAVDYYLLEYKNILALYNAGIKVLNEPEPDQR